MIDDFELEATIGLHEVLLILADGITRALQTADLSPTPDHVCKQLQQIAGSVAKIERAIRAQAQSGGEG